MVTQYDNFTREELIAEHVSLQHQHLFLKAELDQLKRLIYGSKSERFVPVANPNQAALELEREVSTVAAPTLQTVIYERVKKQSSVSEHAGRYALPANLPRVEIIIEPDCDVTGLKYIGKEITEQ